MFEVEDEDEQFCSGLRHQGLSFNQFVSEVQQYSKAFLPQNDESRSNGIFDLLCVTIAKSLEVKPPSKSFKRKTKRSTPLLNEFISHVSEKELNRKPIKLIRYR